jgi:PAS domain S-box-containing protein
VKARIATKLILSGLVLLGLMQIGSTIYFIGVEEDLSDRTFTEGAQAYVSNLASSMNLATRSSPDEPETIVESALLPQFVEVSRFNRDLVYIHFYNTELWPLAGFPPDLAVRSSNELAVALAGPHRMRSYTVEFEGRPALEVTSPLLIKGSVVGLVVAGFSTERLVVAKDRIRRQAVLYSMLAFGAATIVIAILARHLTQPLADLSGVVQQVAEGDLTARASVDRVDEIGKLAASFNHMTEALEASVAELEASEGRYRSLFEHALEGVFRADSSLRLTLVNPALSRLLRRPSDDLVGRNLLEFCPDESVRDVLSEALDRDRMATDVEIPLRAADGVDISARIRVYEVSKAPEGPAYYEGTVEDITEQRALETRMRDVEKMTSIGTLASGIAHDFNNLLTAIIGFSSVVLSHLDPEDPNHSRVKRIEEAGRRGSDLTRRLLAFSRQAPAIRRPVNVNAVVDEAAPLLRQTIAPNVEIVVDTATDLPLVKVDPGQLHQVVINLAVNGRDAMPEGGILTLKTGSIDLGSEEVRHHEDAAPGTYVLLSVEDTGVGISEQTKGRIFDPFFTTKPTGSGTGLGLSIVYGIVKSHKGFVTVESDTSGTRFDVYIPAITEPGTFVPQSTG